MNQDVTECASLPERPTSIEDFDFLKPISRGAFGKVFLGHKKNQEERKYAIKVMKKSDMVNKNLVSQVLAERDALVLSNSPFIVHLFYSLQSQNNVFLIMEYLIGGDVKSLLAVYGYFDEDMSRVYAAEVTLALRYLHSHGIIHRDLKPDNMLITCKGHLKLTDFGLSKINLDGGSVTSSDCLSKTPLPYSKMAANLRTPGQILSFKSNLGLSLQSLKRHKLSSLLEESESKKSLGSIKSLHSPIGQSSAKPMSLRERVVSQGTLARLTPPVRSLTPTLQDSLNWSQSNPSESGPGQIESTRLSGNYNHHHSLPMPTVSRIEESSKGLSISFEESVFDSSTDLSVSERSSYSVFDPCSLRNHGCHGNAVSDSCGPQHHGCHGNCCNSHLKAPSRQESLLDDTPQMHRTDESVWNSYAARNLRSLRYGSYSEDSEEENEALGHHRDGWGPLRYKNSIKKTKTLENKKRGTIRSGSRSYHSDEEIRVNPNNVKKNLDRKRKFCLVDRSPALKQMYPRNSGLTQNIQVFSMFGDEHRLKRQETEDSECHIKEIGGQGTTGHSVNQETRGQSATGHLVNHETKGQSATTGHLVNHETRGQSATTGHSVNHETRGQSATTGHSVNVVKNSDVIVPPLDQIKIEDQIKSGDQTGEESLLMMSGIDHINISDLSDNSPEGKEVKPKVKEDRPETKETQVHFLSHVSSDNFPSCTASVPATPETGQPKRAAFQTPSTPVSGRKIHHAGTPFLLKTPSSQTVGTPTVHRTPATRKTPFKTPRSVRRGRPLNDEDNRILGTPDYLAPEILLQKSHDEAVDWWALGVCLFEFLTGVPPFNDQSPELVFQNILNRDIPWPGEDEEPLSEAAVSAIDSLLTMEPTDRPRDREVQKLAFFDGVDWGCLLDVEPPFVPQPDDDEDTTYFEARNSQQQLMVSGIDL